MHNSSTAGRKGPDTYPWSIGDTRRGQLIAYEGSLDGPGISLLLLVVAARPGPQWEETGPKFLAFRFIFYHPRQLTGASGLEVRRPAQEVKKGIMTRRIENPAIFIHHWRWLEANGYKRQAASCKRQAASLTRKYYNDIQEIKGERYGNKKVLR